MLELKDIIRFMPLQGWIQTLKKGGSTLELQLQPSCKLKTKKKKKKRSSPADNSCPSP